MYHLACEPPNHPFIKLDFWTRGPPLASPQNNKTPEVASCYFSWLWALTLASSKAARSKGSFGRPQARRCTNKLVHTKCAAHKRWLVALCGTTPLIVCTALCVHRLVYAPPCLWLYGPSHHPLLELTLLDAGGNRTPPYAGATDPLLRAFPCACTVPRVNHQTTRCLSYLRLMHGQRPQTP